MSRRGLWGINLLLVESYSNYDLVRNPNFETRFHDLHNAFLADSSFHENTIVLFVCGAMLRVTSSAKVSRSSVVAEYVLLSVRSA